MGTEQKRNRWVTAVVKEDSRKMIRLGVAGPVGDSWSHLPLFTRLVNGCDRAAWEARGLFFSEGEPVKGAKVVGVWCPRREHAEMMADLCGIEKIYGRPEEMISSVDGVMVCDDDSHTHGPWVKLFVEAKVPVLADKPMAGSLDLVEEIVETARRLDAPLLSGSCFRFSPIINKLRQRIEWNGPTWSVVATGPMGRLPYYGVHPLEAAHSIMGPGIRWVQNAGDPDRHILRAAYEDGRSIVLQCIKGIAYCVHLSIFGAHGTMDMELADWDEDISHQVSHKTLLYTFLGMIKTGIRPIPLDTMLEIMRIVYLGEKSLALGGQRILLNK
jgi:predicted dehydrogenase